MQKSRKIPIKVALILILVGSVSSYADVKLRIYLQDGTLQAGNLVSETPDAFVILGKEGRLEVKKEKIMFINGKTLKQWQERPDKLFQTEIIPSEIPNPAYVNDKAPIPSLPEAVPHQSVASVPKPTNGSNGNAATTAKTPIVEPVKPLTELLPKPNAPAPAKKEVSASNAPTTATSAATNNALAATSMAASSIPESSVSKVAETVVSPVTGKKPKKHKKHVEPVAIAEAAAPILTPKPTPKSEKNEKTSRAQNKQVEEISQNPIEAISRTAIKTQVISNAAVADLLPPSKFVRKDLGDFHFERAKRFLVVGDRGRAIQELHLSTVLDRQNPDSVILLGKLYVETKQFVRAKKYFSHPLVKKVPEVKDLNNQIDEEEKNIEQSRKIFFAIVGVGALAWIPLLIGLRMFKKPTKRVFTAENIEDLKVEESAGPEPAFTGFKPPAVKQSEAPKPTPQIPSPIAVSTPPPVISKAVVPPVPVSPIQTTPAPVAKKPEVPGFDRIDPPVQPPMPPPAVQPVLSGVPLLPPVEKPEPAPRSLGEGGDVQSVLRLASMVDRAIRNGNELAVEEKFDLARREYRTAMALNPGCIEAYLGLGYLCFAQGQWDLALEHYVKALGIDPNSADAHYGIGRVFLEIERVDEAIFEFQKTLNLDPGFDDARETLTALGAVV